MSQATEAEVTLALSEYEASVLTGALAEFAETYEEESHTASMLAGLLRQQLPAEWVDG